MPVWDAKMETGFFDETPAYEDVCEVRIDGSDIVVSYAGEGGEYIIYTGKDYGNGHFVLECPSLHGKATLHRIMEGQYLEGYWIEESVRGFWRISLLDKKTKNIDNDAKVKSPEVRDATSDFPNLVTPNGRPICPIKIDVDSLSQVEPYQFGGWEDLIFEITAKWVKESSFQEKGTIWAFGAMSNNFHHQSFSMFYAVLGMPKEFKNYLRSRIKVLGEHVRPHSDYIIPSAGDGWDARCHVESGKAWQIIDPVTLKEIQA